jgi:hypothetical protein
MSKKIKGADTILYNAVAGAVVTSGALTADSWYKIKAKATTGSALPALSLNSVFKTPKLAAHAITLVTGDSVWPLTLSEICKCDVEFSGEMGTIDTTDSCDYPYTTNIPDGFTSLSGSINTMLRFDDTTEELVAVTLEFLKKFYDIVADDGEGVYTLTEKDDSDILAMILLSKNALDADSMVENWMITPMILNSISNNIALKDVLKGDYGWTKGQGPAMLYMRTVPATS